MVIVPFAVGVFVTAAFVRVLMWRLEKTSAKEIPDESEIPVRCTCEWESPMSGDVDARWPFVIDPYCRVHGAPGGSPMPCRCVPVEGEAFPAREGDYNELLIIANSAQNSVREREEAAYNPAENGTTPPAEAGPTVRESLKVREANVVWYELPLPVLMGYTGLPADELDGAEFHGTDPDGEESSITFAEALASVEKMGAWGYFDRPRQEIHAWIAADCELGFAVHFLAHELAHATGLDTSGPADVDDELRAELVGEIARHAYELAADRLAYLQSLAGPADPATRDRKGAAMHALVTACPDLWEEMDAEERAGWIQDAERYEAMLRGGIATGTLSPSEEG